MKTKWKEYSPYIFSIILALGIGVLSYLLSASGMAIYESQAVKPLLTPPGWLFSVAWSILYTLMGISAVRIWRLSENTLRHKGLNLYVLQLIVNFFWSLIFFNAQAFGFAVLWLLLLWILVFLMIRQFYKLDKTAAYLQIPYLLWLTFAAYLNIGVWVLNG